MLSSYSYIDDLNRELEIPKDGILSRTIYDDQQVKVVLFGFDTDQELSEHTASLPAVLHFVRGQAKLTLGDDSRKAVAGTWVHMERQLPHTIYAETPVVMLLILLKTVG